MEPFAAREIGHHGVRESGPWALKLYSVVYGHEPLDWAGFEPALALAEQSLPEPSVDAGRPGLGFVIAHRGKTGDYLVLCWWNHENELPTAVWVRRADGEGWRPAVHGESICVWDLEVIWAEREAWVRTMMTAEPDAARYLGLVGTDTR